MDLIAAVYDDWGIGCNGTQPITLSADRKFFRQTTKGATVIVGRRTVDDFPGKQPLPGRKNVMLSRNSTQSDGFSVCRTPEEAALLTQSDEKVFVIGGGTVYRSMLPYCTNAYITKVHAAPISDTYLPNLDDSAEWELQAVLQSGEENGIQYEMCLYSHKKAPEAFTSGVVTPL